MRLPVVLQSSANPSERPTYRPDYSSPWFRIPMGIAAVATFNACTVEYSIHSRCSSLDVDYCRAHMYQMGKMPTGASISSQQLTNLFLVVLTTAIAFAPSLIANTCFRPNRSS